MAIKIAGTEVINDNRELVLAKLTEINTSIADTAVDIFVYDTRKDSDGGQWRHRCQHTSWYNETLNTATRGSRKEFPAVAVIVAESNQVTIYDGDDPDLPMWMVFNVARTPTVTMLNWFTGSQAVVSSVAQLNGRLCVGTDGGVTQFDFVEDAMYLSYTPSTAYTPINNRLSSRNDSNAASAGSSNENFYFIVNTSVNDVAMTVLPNAPIDATTGLPVPTIAVATSGGTSIIKDDGNVYDVTGFQPVANVNFYGDKLAINTPVGSTSYVNIGTANLSADIANTNWREVNLSSSTSFDFKILPNQAAHQAFDDTYYSAGSVGLLSVKPDYVAPETCLHAFTTSSYNTGWMNGDIKLATLSDTDATNVTGSELVTNGDGSTTTGWTAYFATLSASGGSLHVADNGGYSKAYQAFTTEVGKTYTVSAEVTAVTGLNAVLAARHNSPEAQNWGSLFAIQTTSSPAVLTGTFVATATTTYIELGSESIYTSSWTNISVRLAEEDRSVNGNGLQVFGTVTKSAVATGADLVAYSGFSSSNYLQQPYNSDLDFGTGDFCYQFWEKHTAPATTYGWIVDYDREATAGWVLIGATNGTQMRFEVASGVLADVAAPYGVWNCWAFVRRNNVCYVYHNGEQIASFSDGGANINASSRGNGLNLGALKSASSTEHFTTGSLALFRISATAPSPEQIKKIYEDEKVLFQENAQATLYGSSDAVTALAYDDTTELLHVGTSAGRSVFQGLRRVDNTTTAVGAAISASNGLVADE